MRKMLCLVILFMCLFQTEVIAKEFPKQVDVPLEKVWTILFNSPVDMTSVNSSTIFVKNSSNLEVPTTLTLSSDGKSVYVDAVPDYAMDGEYLLTVTTGVKSNGKNLNEASQIAFATKKRIPVTLITLNKTSLIMTEGDAAATLIATVTPTNATNKALTWKSSNDNIVTVNNGTITPYSPGTATISAMSNDNSSVSASCTVTVNPDSSLIGLSRNNPAKVGDIVTITDNSIWTDYTNITFELGVVQSIRGSEAWTIVKNANMFNSQPDSGCEYILVKFKVRVVSSEKGESLDINHARFDAVSEYGFTYNDFFSLAGIKPSLSNDLYQSNRYYEGWTYFQVNQGDEPLIVFDQGSNSRERWFSLEGSY